LPHIKRRAFSFSNASTTIGPLDMSRQVFKTYDRQHGVKLLGLVLGGFQHLMARSGSPFFSNCS